MPISELEIIIKVLLVCFLSGLIGLEREIHGRPAGLRTHILVGMGACLMMIISKYAFPDDPARIAAQVVSGIGFLGAGTIMREGLSIKGLTTAASLWVVSGIGLAVGCGFYFSGAFVTFLVVLALFFLELMEKQLFKEMTCEIRVTIDDSEQKYQLKDILDISKFSIKNLSLRSNAADQETLLVMTVFNKDLDRDHVWEELAHRPGVKKVVIK